VADLRGRRQREQQQAKDGHGAHGKGGIRAGAPIWTLEKHASMLK